MAELQRQGATSPPAGDTLQVSGTLESQQLALGELSNNSVNRVGNDSQPLGSTVKDYTATPDVRDGPMKKTSTAKLTMSK